MMLPLVVMLVLAGVLAPPAVDGAALTERPPEKRFFFPYRTFTKVFYFKSTTTVVAPAVCFSIPAQLTECAPGIQPSTTMSPSSSLRTRAPEPMANPLAMLRGSQATPWAEELQGPDRDTWGFFGLTIDSTVTRVINDLETLRLEDPAHTATLVLQGCRPTPAGLPQPPCPTATSASPLMAAAEVTRPPAAAVAMATQPLPTAAAVAETGGAPGEGEKGEDERPPQVPQKEEPDQPEKEEYTTPPAVEDGQAGSESPITQEDITTPPAPFTVRQNLVVRDAGPLEVMHDVLLVRPKERIEVQTLSPTNELKLISDTVDAIRMLVAEKEEDGTTQQTTVEEWNGVL